MSLIPLINAISQPSGGGAAASWHADRIFDFDADSLSLANNDPVTSWVSDVGSFTAANAVSDEPTYKTGVANGHSAVDFSAGNKYLTINNDLGSPTALSVGVVCVQKVDQTGESGRIINATSNWLLALQRSDGLNFYNEGVTVASGESFSLDTVYVLLATMDGAAAKLWRDGSDVTDTGSSSAIPSHLHFSTSPSTAFAEPGKAQVLRFITWDKVLNGTERADFFADMATAYQ